MWYVKKNSCKKRGTQLHISAQEDPFKKLNLLKSTMPREHKKIDLAQRKNQVTIAEYSKIWQHTMKRTPRNYIGTKGFLNITSWYFCTF